jgi:predicted RNA-binding protein
LAEVEGDSVSFSRALPSPSRQRGEPLCNLFLPKKRVEITPRPRKIEEKTKKAQRNTLIETKSKKNKKTRKQPKLFSCFSVLLKVTFFKNHEFISHEKS